MLLSLARLDRFAFEFHANDAMTGLLDIGDS
jgi:hypothetical protein